MNFPGKALARLGVLICAASLVAPAQTSASSDNFRFALAGDSIIDRRISIYDEPGYLQLFDRIRNADAAFTNFEMLVHDFEFPGAPVSGGTYMGAPAWVLDELKWAGFRLFGVANNHAFDFGTEGLLSNLHSLRQAGVVYAGAGDNLARARAPGYLDTKKGRVALIACASTFSILSPVGVQRPDMKGRPGLNPLRFQTTYTVDPSTLASLRVLAQGKGMGEGGAPAAGGDLHFLGATFRTGGKTGVNTEPDARDLKEITAEIREARRQADWVMVSIHSHEGAPGDREAPAQFLVTFAHAAIDAGADLFVGHGPHVLRAIEVYKGKPIFYSVANFIFQNESLPFQPQESHDLFNLPLDATTADYFDTRSANDTRSFPADQKIWESVLAEAVFNRKRELQEIDLYPITLGFHESRTKRGRPQPATGELATSIIDRVAKLSKGMGKNVVSQDGKGVVTVASRSSVQSR
jgi:poly-gamma-glutamate capsule biosynthesis protein CapA/YwtB (metallophosphatase superfamily)